MTWNELCCSERCRGRWVALEGPRTAKIVDATGDAMLVDVDDDLDELCCRVRDSGRRNCAIVFVVPRLQARG